MSNGYCVFINTLTIVVTHHDGWENKKVEAFHTDDMKDKRFMEYVPLSEVINECKLKFEL